MRYSASTRIETSSAGRSIAIVAASHFSPNDREFCVNRLAMSNGILRVAGDQVVDGKGNPVILRGAGLGGWMKMENFITGFPGKYWSCTMCPLQTCRC